MTDLSSQNDMSNVASARVQSASRRWKNLAQSRFQSDAARKWFAELLWVAFPATNERELARRASLALGCSERQVLNWLRMDNDASLTNVAKVMLIARLEPIFQKIEGPKL